MLGYLDQKIPKGPPPKDMSEMITRRLDKMDHMMQQKMFPGYEAGKPPEGWESENMRRMPAQSASAPQHASQAPQSGGNPAGWESENKEKEEDHG